MRELLPGLTLTGADETTPLDALIGLADAGAEIGLLYSFAPDGRRRYPRRAWIAEAIRALDGRAALHVCGNRARLQLLQGHLDELIASVRRVQINGRLSPLVLWTVCKTWPSVGIITQHTDDNAALLDTEAVNHALLIDASGGRGILPALWRRPRTDKPVGFAGGLGPATLAAALPAIAAASGGRPFWVDMEGKLRDEADRFDVAAAREVLAIVEGWRPTP